MIFALGNPGKEYANTRHNAGVRALDLLAEYLRSSVTLDGTWQTRAKVQFCRVRIKTKELILAKPLVYMNENGLALRSILGFFKIPIQEVLVLHDDLETNAGSVLYKVGGGSAGHNGLRSIDTHCGKNYGRMRIGIGRPAHGAVHAWVLGKFTSDEEILFAHAFDAMVASPCILHLDQ